MRFRRRLIPPPLSHTRLKTLSNLSSVNQNFVGRVSLTESGEESWIFDVASDGNNESKFSMSYYKYLYLYRHKIQVQ